MEAAAWEDSKSASDSSFSVKKTPYRFPKARIVPILNLCRRMGMANALLKLALSISNLFGLAYFRRSRTRNGLVAFKAACMMGSLVGLAPNEARSLGASPVDAMREKFPC